MPDRSGERGSVADIVEFRHLLRIEACGAGDLDPLGNGDPLKTCLFALREPIDQKESPDHPCPTGGLDDPRGDPP